jgi:hypothetical protein
MKMKERRNSRSASHKEDQENSSEQSRIIFEQRKVVLPTEAKKGYMNYVFAAKTPSPNKRRSPNK